MKSFIAIKAAVFSLLLLSGCTVKLQQQHFIRPDQPVTQQWLTEQQQGQTLHAYQVTTSDGEVLHGKLIRHPNARFTMIYLLPWCFTLFHKMNFIVLGAESMGMVSLFMPM